MLQRLHIKNYALIDQLDISFHPGFSVITGETGAGKSIILGAIGLLLGERADTKHIKPGASRCIVEAEFDLSDGGMDEFFTTNGLDFDGHECIIRRELSATGKSRSFINDTPVSVASLKDLGSKLVDIHSQHQNLLVNDRKFQLSILDTVAGNRNLLSEYQSLYITYRDTCQRLTAFEQAAREREQNNDYINFQLNELTEAQLRSGELEKLEEEAQMLNNAGTIKESLYLADRLLASEKGGALTRINDCIRSLQNISSVFAKVTPLTERLDSCAIEIDDIEHEISSYIDSVNFDPDRQAKVNERIDTLNTLLSKYHQETVDDLITLRDKLQGEVQMLADSDDTLLKLRQQRDKLKAEATELAYHLSQTRHDTVAKVEASMLTKLHSLGMPNIRFEVQLEQLPELSPLGLDKATFLFSANKDIPLQDIASIGSGGEIARVMLSLKALLSTGQSTRTLIFDEIDTGVSGRIAEQMALMMKDISNAGHQVISITHLPQIAAQGEHHYLVYKAENDGRTATFIRELTPEERVAEIAHMLSGAQVTQAAMDNARALLHL